MTTGKPVLTCAEIPSNVTFFVGIAENGREKKMVPANKDRLSVAVKVKICLAFAVFLTTSSLDCVARAQSWAALDHQPCSAGQPCFLPGTALLLTDGTVLAQNNGGSDWFRLSPDNTGSYVNGTWTQVASLPSGYAPLYFASAVLPDGRLLVEGGEYNFLEPAGTTLGAIYDPLVNSWTPVAPPTGWCCISDAQSVVLADGRFMLANADTSQQAILNAATLTWTATGMGKADINNEEGWTLLPNKQLLTVDARNGTNSELYVPASGKWHSAGSTIVQLSAGLELGPAVLRPDGTVLATGANGHTAVYDTSTGAWSIGPDFPVVAAGQLAIADGPASLLVTGNVLCDASVPGILGTFFFEFDGTNLNQVPGPPNAPFDQAFYGRMLALPTGQILFTDGSPDVEVYTPAGGHRHDWAPRIQSAPSMVTPGGAYVISGHLFNGLSQGAAYGDDAQSATNYPLVRITNLGTGHVFYSRTHDHSSMAVAFGGLVSTHFDVPLDQETGPSSLVVVANGIPSNPVAINVQ
jgi:hypothetical protein